MSQSFCWAAVVVVLRACGSEGGWVLLGGNGDHWGVQTGTRAPLAPCSRVSQWRAAWWAGQAGQGHILCSDRPCGGLWAWRKQE